ncbi:MAG: hypothetical protein ACR5K2_03060 [Wolbachia sp.]
MMVFGCSSGSFQEGASLEEKVNYIAKGIKPLKAIKSKELESKIKNIVKLNKELESRKSYSAEKYIKISNESLSLTANIKARVFSEVKNVEPKSDKELQDTSKSLQ